jgi:hypothetical protein
VALEAACSQLCQIAFVKSDPGFRGRFREKNRRDQMAAIPGTDLIEGEVLATAERPPQPKLSGQSKGR